MEFTGEAIKIEAPNIFDDYGAILDLPRIQDESLAVYKTRLQDVAWHRAGHEHAGLTYGLNRELGLRAYEAGLIVQPRKRIDGQLVARDLSMEVRADGIRFYTGKFESRESHRIPTDTLRVTLTYELRSADPYVEYEGNRLSRHYYWIDHANNQIEFHHDYAGKIITVTYYYSKNVPINQPMSDIITGINEVRIAVTGEYLATGQLAQGLLTGDTGEGLFLRAEEHLLGYRSNETGDWYNEIHCAWGEASIRALHDEDYVDANESPYGTYFGTVLMRMVEAAKNVAHVTWGQMTFGYDRFNSNIGLAEIPTLMDGRVGRWKCSNPNHERTYRPEEAADLGMICPHDGYSLVLMGIGPKKMQSGVGGEDDLKLIVEEGSLDEFQPTIYDVVAMTDGTFTTPSSDTETEMIGEGL